jgi:uncharacterized damage-inducible protein DinB
MPIIDGIAQEFTQECALTRKLLERAPEDHFGWKPHEKSMTLGALASHLVDSVGWLGATLDLDVFEIDPGSFKPFVATNRAELLSAFDKNVKEGADLMKGRSDDHVLAEWKMVVGGRTVIAMPRLWVLRTFIIKHQVHHRGQLDVYLRLKDIPLPQIYGPTADDPNRMGA